jgi:hypothetical protein
MSRFGIWTSAHVPEYAVLNSLLPLDRLFRRDAGRRGTRLRAAPERSCAATTRRTDKAVSCDDESLIDRADRGSRSMKRRPTAAGLGEAERTFEQMTEADQELRLPIVGVAEADPGHEGPVHTGATSVGQQMGDRTSLRQTRPSQFRKSVPPAPYKGFAKFTESLSLK